MKYPGRLVSIDMIGSYKGNTANISYPITTGSFKGPTFADGGVSVIDQIRWLWGKL